ncbi:MAG: corrinoid protein [Anaerolineae bacterium]
MDLLQELSQALINGNAPKTKELTQKAVADGVAPGKILNEGLIVGMNEVGRRFKNNEFYVPEVLIAARAMHAAMDVVKPLLADSDVKPAGSVAIGTVKGDLHDIGKNLVAMMLEGAGFEVIDMGVDASPEKFLNTVKEKKPNLIGLSALLTTTMPSMKATIEALKEGGVRGQVKVMIGGAPVTQRYADEIGADGYAPDAASAVDIARSLLGMGA